MAISKFFSRLFGSRNERYLRSCAPLVAQVNAHEPAMQALSDDALRAKTVEFRRRRRRRFVRLRGFRLA